MRTAQEAVHSDIDTSRSVYKFRQRLCVKLGANADDLVPFEKYAAAAQSPGASGTPRTRAHTTACQHRTRRQAGAADRQAEASATPSSTRGRALVEKPEANRKKAAAA